MRAAVSETYRPGWCLYLFYKRTEGDICADGSSHTSPQVICIIEVSLDRPYRGVISNAICMVPCSLNRSYHCNIKCICYNVNAAKGSKIIKMSSFFCKWQVTPVGRVTNKSLRSDQIMTLVYFTSLLQTVATVEVVGFCSSCVSLSQSTVKISFWNNNVTVCGLHAKYIRLNHSCREPKSPPFQFSLWGLISEKCM